MNEPLHILVEAELPVEIIDAQLMQAREILEYLLKPDVSFPFTPLVNPIRLLCKQVCLIWINLHLHGSFYFPYLG